jgi:sulfatase modifying factor 1
MNLEEHPLDGGAVPPRVVRVDPFFIDVAPVTNKEYGKFVRATYYETEAEKFGWSFVLSSFLPNATSLETADVDPEAEDWVATDKAYWRNPEGPGTSYKYRENHPVVHVSHRDAAEYCKWVGKRLPGEREWEAAARAGHFGPNNRTLFIWGEAQDVSVAKEYTNLWGAGSFPWENHAEDGYRGTSPVKSFQPNSFGLYDMTGNVWEWMRGGKHKARIVRGASYVDSLDGSFNHAATLGARATLHGTTTTGNVGFRCVKSPKRRVEHHWVYENEENSGSQLVLENADGTRQFSSTKPQHQNEDDEFDDEDDHDPTKPRPDEKRGRKKVVKPRTLTSDEL